MSEYTPPWSNVKMTKAQVRKYIADMKAAELIAKEKIRLAEANWEFEKEKQELAALEKKLDNYMV